MKKLLVVLLGSMISFSALANVNNTIRGSYGRWIDPEGNNIDITSRGMKLAYTASNGCKRKPYYIHEKSMLQGSKLLRDIKSSIEDRLASESESEVSPQQVQAEMKQFYALISPQKSYMRIDTVLSCADGMSSFIYINEKVSIGVLSAPDDNYYLLIKK